MDTGISRAPPCLGGMFPLTENQIVLIVKRLDYLEFGGFSGGHVRTRKYDKQTDMGKAFVMDKVSGHF